MDLCNITEIKALLARHGFHFSKAKGQNFLTQSWVPQNIVLEAGIAGTRSDQIYVHSASRRTGKFQRIS